MNVTVACEHNPAMDSEEGKRAYPEGLGVCLKEMLSEAGHCVTLVTMDENGAEGLTDDILAKTDVMFWWGHWYHQKVSDEIIGKVADRALRGMGMVFLHSAHVLDEVRHGRAPYRSDCSQRRQCAGSSRRAW